jgi:hypothetical protein
MICILILLIIICGIAYLIYKKQLSCHLIEKFNDQSGRFCPDCRNKTFNECLRCFNCGWCVDKDGNSGCVGGDHNGPYNYENCAKWYYIDPFTYMSQINKDYKCSYGPRASNRVIGV